MSARLSARSTLDGLAVDCPAYVPEAHGVGIVHLGIGAFHKAHQAFYTDTALCTQGGDWRILGVSLRSGEAAAALNPQDGRYTLLTREAAGTRGRIVASIAKVVVAPDDPDVVIDALADARTRVITLTVTEKAYGIDPATNGLDLSHEAVAHDLVRPGAPKGVIGFLVAGLRRRAACGSGPVTILSCDNIPENGRVLERLVFEFARRTDEGLADWIGENVGFPSSMVDRITPASTIRTLQEAERLTGYRDEAAVETEPFSQWVVEDDFAAGRPAWEQAGVLFAADVVPYEKMKLRMLNGAHSLLAYAGFLAGYETVAEAMGDAALRRLAERQMIGAAATLPPVPGIDLSRYRTDLLARFSNGAIRHLTYQIAMDGTQKLPPRILSALAEEAPPEPFAFAVAAWMRYCLGVTETGEAYDLRDPREGEIAARAASAGRDPAALYDALSSLPRLFPEGLAAHEALRLPVIGHLQVMLELGMAQAIRQADDGH